MIDHLSLPVADLARSCAFYDAALAPLGYRQVMYFDGGHYVTAAYGPDESKPIFWIGAGKTEGQSMRQLPGFHIAFMAPDRAAVDAFHKAALAAGASDNGAPGLRPEYHPNYYAGFVADPDGYHIEAVCHGPE